MSTDLDTVKPSANGDDAGAQIKPSTDPIPPAEANVIDCGDTASSDDSEPVSDNTPVTPSDLPPPLVSAASEPPRLSMKSPPMSLPHGPTRIGAQPGLRAPLMSTTSATPIPPSLQARLAAMASRGQRPPPAGGPPSMRSGGIGSAPGGLNAATASLGNLQLGATKSARPPPGMSASARRAKPIGLTLDKIMGPSTSSNAPPPPASLRGAGGGAGGAGLGPGRALSIGTPPRRPQPAGTPFSNFSTIVDPSGALNFAGKAVLHASGVDFSNGSSFAVSMGEFQLDEELGRGNYGAVKKVLHKPTNVIMAMKEIRLELEDSKLNAIIMELDILHRAVAPEIVEFYGAFFVESCVYYCMEYMDAGSLEKLELGGIPEPVLARITQSTVKGLKFLKDELQIMHRDVKPTNVLVNRKGEVKLCDFGVSGQLERSLAKTNIGCQSYMAPERIQGESQNNLGTYTVSSDIWSLGLSLVELAMGQYPYPPETFSNVFAQLTAIVHEPPPQLPAGYSDAASNFVEICLMKDPLKRGTYAQLLEHPFLVEDRTREVDMVAWVESAIAKVADARKVARAAAAGVTSPGPNIPAPLAPAPTPETASTASDETVKA